MEGFEPTTPSTQSWYATKLRHIPTVSSLGRKDANVKQIGLSGLPSGYILKLVLSADKVAPFKISKRLFY
jgi:hypothetical protein